MAADLSPEPVARLGLPGALAAALAAPATSYSPATRYWPAAGLGVRVEVWQVFSARVRDCAALVRIELEAMTSHALGAVDALAAKATSSLLHSYGFNFAGPFAQRQVRSSVLLSWFQVPKLLSGAGTGQTRFRF